MTDKRRHQHEFERHPPRQRFRKPGDIANCSQDDSVHVDGMGSVRADEQAVSLLNRHHPCLCDVAWERTGKGRRWTGFHIARQLTRFPFFLSPFPNQKAAGDSLAEKTVRVWKRVAMSQAHRTDRL
ncbi:hypothetical protein [Thalassoroseus pseudoceratinae]|uniref:hypothetical protein n=1 Tax=Thalassoroseus pseudoceratinae TaxID=2713176 RepID=UPI00141EAF22|nr:hypothetical protein [Thalassoroseus pseudoceratinae]